MSHEIEKNDLTYSTSSAEWHGKAIVKEKIDKESIKPILFPLLESVSQSFVLEDGTAYDGGQSKGIFADLRERDGQILQLSTMGEGYCKISNEAIFDALQSSFDRAGCKAQIVTAGTLGDCRKFYLSAAIEGSETFTVGGDKFLSYLNFISSHDGTLACQAYDSNIRIVCMNTLKWSLEAAGNVDFKIKHTKNASAHFENMENLLSEILAGRDIFKNEMESLASEACGVDRAENIVKGYLATVTNVKKGMEISTRSKNVGLEILNLYMAGKGNKGETLYDLANGATEAWTHGEAVGKANVSQAVRYTKASFGMASDHKLQFVQSLTNPAKRAKLEEVGKGFASLYA